MQRDEAAKLLGMPQATRFGRVGWKVAATRSPRVGSLRAHLSRKVHGVVGIDRQPYETTTFERGEDAVAIATISHTVGDI